MKKASLVLYQGNGFSIEGPKRFKKDVLRVGRWTHPLTGQDVNVTQERIVRLAAATERYRDTMDRKAIPFPDGHTFDAKKNLGYWTGFAVEGDRLVGTVEVTDDVAARKIEQGSIRSVSAHIAPDVRDTQGNVYDEALLHVCATPIPVLDGQQDFVKLSREADTIDLVIPTNIPGMSPEGPNKENRMFKAIALALGLSEDADEAKIVAELKKSGETVKGLTEKLKGFESLAAVKPEELKAHGLELKDGKVVKLAAAPPADETPRERELREEVEALKKATALSRHQDMEKTVAAFVQAGQLPPAGKTVADRMLSRVREAQSLMLSGTPKEGLKRFTEVMEENSKDLVELMRVLPKITGEALSAGQQDEVKKAEEASQKKVDEIAQRNQPEPAKK